MGNQPFSTAWVIASVIVFTVLELLIGIVLAPAIFTGRFVASQMWQMRVEMMMHLGSFYLGGIVVGIISPRVRMLEPAVGAFVSVLLVFLMAIFMPGIWLHFAFGKVLVGGGIAFALALAGAYTGEKWMGNVPDGDVAASSTARGQLRERLWGDDGLMSRGDKRFLDPRR